MERLHDSSPVLVPSHDSEDHFLHAPTVAEETVECLGCREHTFMEPVPNPGYEPVLRQALVIR
jgi:hypothetical protein